MEKIKRTPEVLPVGDYLVGVSELVSFLGVSQPTGRKIIKKRELPFFKIGGKYYFEKSRIRESLEIKRVEK